MCLGLEGSDDGLWGWCPLFGGVDHAAGFRALGRLLVVQRGGSGMESFGGVLVGGERERVRFRG